jgi:hypothetical protein
MPDMYTGDYNLKKRNLTEVLIFFVFAIFFGALLVVGKPLYLGDTYQYEMQFVTREPIYSLIIQLFRFISADNHYYLIIVFQNILAVIANTIFVCNIRKMFDIKNYMLPIIIILVLSPHIMTPLASSTGMIITNSLLSEGVSYSLYLFFILHMLKAIMVRKVLGKDSILAVIWAVVVSMVRGQFMALLIAWLVAMFVILMIDKKWKNLVIAIMIIAVGFVGRSLIVKTYNYCENGLFVTTATGGASFVSNVIYVTDREDGESIEDDGIRQVFYEIYDMAYEGGYNYKFSPNGLIERGYHLEDSHDRIKFDCFYVVANEYISQTKGISIGDYQLMMVEADKVASSLIAKLLPKVFGRWIYNYLAMATMGFIRSVAVVNSVLNWYAVGIYILAIILTILVWRHNHNSKQAYFMALVLLLIVGNVTATSLMIMCISRYVLYNLPLFYLAFILLVKEYIGIYMAKKLERN